MLIRELGLRGHEWPRSRPDLFRTVPCPTIPRSAWRCAAGRRVGALIDGGAARRHPYRHRGAARHRRAALVPRARLRLHHRLSTRAFRNIWRRVSSAPAPGAMRCCGASMRRRRRVMVATEIGAAARWRRAASPICGAGAAASTPSSSIPRMRGDAPRHRSGRSSSPVGRVAVEKNLAAFLALDLPGSKVVVGDGPNARRAAAPLSRRAFSRPARERRELARLYASADVFVFPSRTDTFGLVMLEALASGLPVAAYPVPGPLDVIGRSGAGVLDEDLPPRGTRRARDPARALPRACAALHLGGFRGPVHRESLAAGSAAESGVTAWLLAQSLRHPGVPGSALWKVIGPNPQMAITAGSFPSCFTPS